MTDIKTSWHFYNFHWFRSTFQINCFSHTFYFKYIDIWNKILQSLISLEIPPTREFLMHQIPASIWSTYVFQSIQILFWTCDPSWMIIGDHMLGQNIVSLSMWRRSVLETNRNYNEQNLWLMRTLLLIFLIWNTFFKILDKFNPALKLIRQKHSHCF